MKPQEALDTVRRGIRQSPAFSPADIITRDPDFQGVDNRLSTPFVTIIPISTTRESTHNTDRVGFVTDDQGNRTGEIYDLVFVIDIQVDVYLAAGDERNVTELGGRLRRALLEYDSSAIDSRFPSPDDDPTLSDDVRDFDAGTGQQADDLSGPGIRRWRHSVQMRYVSTVAVTDGIEAFETIQTPSDPDLEPVDSGDGDSDGGSDVEFEYIITA